MFSTADLHSRAKPNSDAPWTAYQSFPQQTREQPASELYGYINHMNHRVIRVHLAWLALLVMPEGLGLLPLAPPIFSTNVALGGGASPPLMPCLLGQALPHLRKVMGVM
jgi:hypothetical protein